MIPTRSLPILKRLARAMLLVAFAVGSPAVGGAYRCCTVEKDGSEHHGSSSHATQHVAHEVVAEPAPLDAHSHHGAHEAAAPPERSQDAPAPASPCECVGQCHVATPAPQVVATIATVEVIEAAAPVTVDGFVLSAPADRGDHRQPFPNGPPATQRA